MLNLKKWMIKVSEKLTSLSNNKQNVLTTELRTNETSTTINEGSATFIDIDINKEGYHPLGIVGIQGNGTGNVMFEDWYLLNDNTVRVYVRNAMPTQITITRLRARVLYYKI